jgi:ubiquinone/menaquinone biosynthesis C-methylase UbiE
MEDLEKNSIVQFNSWAENYDNPSIRNGFFTRSNKAIVKLLPQTFEVSILDVGTGTGILIEQVILKNKSAHLFGIDISPEMVKKAKRKFQGKNNVTVALGSVNKLPYKDNSFEFVTCANSFHHHPDSMQSLKEIKRVLKPGGKLILSDGCLDGFFRQFVFKIENSINKEGKIFRYTKRQVKDLFVQAGFMNISQHYSLYFNLITTGEKRS